jgi:hypothetical protein
MRSLTPNVPDLACHTATAVTGEMPGPDNVTLISLAAASFAARPAVIPASRNVTVTACQDRATVALLFGVRNPLRPLGDGVVDPGRGGLGAGYPSTCGPS